jgi:hypothetical protein
MRFNSIYQQLRERRPVAIRGNSGTIHRSDTPRVEELSPCAPTVGRFSGMSTPNSERQQLRHQLHFQNVISLWNQKNENNVLTEVGVVVHSG